MFMHDALKNSSAVWTHRVLTVSAGCVRDDRPGKIANLAQHFYSGALARYRACDQDARGRRESTPRRGALELANH